MNNSYKFNDLDYILIKDYKAGFSANDVLDKMTDYFVDYDYVVGDWAYGKLRLKGFYNCNNKKCKQYNNIDNLDDYIKEKCAYECKYFVLKKIDK